MFLHYKSTMKETTLILILELLQFESLQNNTNWCQSGIAIMTTRAAVKMEEQLVALLEKVDQRSEQLQVLTKQQAEQRVDGLAQR